MQRSNDARDLCLFDHLGRAAAPEAIGPIVTACLLDEGHGGWRQRAAGHRNHRYRARYFRVCHQPMADAGMEGRILRQETDTHTGRHHCHDPVFPLALKTSVEADPELAAELDQIVTVFAVHA